MGTYEEVGTDKEVVTDEVGIDAQEMGTDVQKVGTDEED